MSDRLPDLYARAIELDELARRAMLEELRKQEPALASELEVLLAAGQGKPSLLDRSPWSAGAESLDEEKATPERIGPYRILRELGRGGMGRVFLAEEETAEFRRIVAVKVVDRPSFDTDAVRRFRDELRILSSLEHPGIARFLDGGRTGDDTLFLALEYVEGEDLLSYASRNDLSVRQRVELFLAALDAVAYAHGKGVVHRDLKPGHLLVGADGRPRLVDFGISKLVDPVTHASASVTRTESRSLTPAYASPEQFRGEPVTPASDVYSLGVVLYELLAGKRPFADATATALERAVLESDPEPPSTAVRRSATGWPTGTPTRPLRRSSLSRDLDAICLKALRKKPAERYVVAAAMAADLRNFLEGRPVAARRGGRRYRIGRFLHRQRAALAMLSVAVLAVVAVLFAAYALREAESLRPPPPPPPKAFPFHDAELVPLEQFESAFARAPSSVEAGAALALALGSTSRVPEARIVLARLRQIPGKGEDPLIDYVDATLSMNGGEPQRSLVLFTRAKESALRTGRGELIGQIRASRGRLLSTMGERAEARAEMELARAEIERAADYSSLWRVLNDLAIEYLQEGDLDRGSELLEAAVEASRHGRVPADTARLNLGMVSLQRGRPDLAEPQLREVIAAARQGSDKRRLGQSLGFHADVLRELGRQQEALEALDESLSLLRVSGSESNVIDSLVSRTEIALDLADLSQASALALELDGVANRIGDRRAAAYAHLFRSRVAAERGRLAEGRSLFDVGRNLLVDNGDVDQAAELGIIWAEIERRAGDLAAASRRIEQAFAPLQGGERNLPAGFLAGPLRVRIAVESGQTVEAKRQVESIDPENARSPSLTRRLAFLAARAAVSGAEGELDRARDDLNVAIRAATDGGRRLDALYLRADLARLESRTDSGKAGALSAELRREAEALGLSALAAHDPLIE